MAGIVAQFTKANWERIQKRRWFLSADKSNYYLPPFKPYFDPFVHVPYYRRRRLLQQRNEEQRLREQIWEGLAALKEETRRKQQSLSSGQSNLQNASGTICLLVPIAILIFLLINFWQIPKVTYIGQQQ